MFASSTILFLNTNSGAIQALSIIILVLVTGYYAWQTKQQAKATKEQAEITKEIEKNQRIPAVEVYMIYDQDEKQTYFKFFNFSNIPAFVSMHIDFEFPNGEIKPYDIRKEKGYRIGPGVKNIDTQAAFFYKDQDKNKDEHIHNRETKATLNITVKNALSNNPNLEMTYTKEYIFKDDNLGKRWNEETWGFSEPMPLFY